MALEAARQLLLLLLLLPPPHSGSTRTLTSWSTPSLPIASTLHGDLLNRTDRKRGGRCVGLLAMRLRGGADLGLGVRCPRITSQQPRREEGAPSIPANSFPRPRTLPQADQPLAGPPLPTSQTPLAATDTCPRLTPAPPPRLGKRLISQAPPAIKNNHHVAAVVQDLRRGGGARTDALLLLSALAARSNVASTCTDDKVRLEDGSGAEFLLGHFGRSLVQILLVARPTRVHAAPGNGTLTT